MTHGSDIVLLVIFGETNDRILGEVGMIPFWKPGADRRHDRMKAASRWRSLAGSNGDHVKIRVSHAGCADADLTARAIVAAAFEHSLAGAPGSREFRGASVETALQRT